ncbi:MAG: hypothetical protein Q8J68_14780 [Methanolobus sp.]|uniref:hypothetical protein n=1 Tax=Methanolobus sp. TaxID=1874737 RepID=UPI002730689B|nr:hypothetical protein [Methanolobus sp.]MDP2218540.1 hypothetical protein [Methanolobus sp.]
MADKTKGKNYLDEMFPSMIEEFDPEGIGYDYETAKKYGIKPNDTGHYPSRIPETGLLLKGREHPTWDKTVEEEEKLGYKIIKRGNRYFSVKKEESGR